MSPALFRLLVFWAVFALAQAVGTVVALAVDNYLDPQSIKHDILAYVLAAGLSCFCVVEPGAAIRLRRVAWLLVALGAASLLAQLAAASELIETTWFDPWFWDRLRGWSENPNQLAFSCAVLGLVSLHLAETANGLVPVTAAWMGAALSFFVGVLTRSDSFLLVFMVGLLIFLALKIRTWLVSPERRLTFRTASAWIFALSLPLMPIALAPFASSIADGAESFVADVYAADHEGEAAVRLSLWREAISRGLDAGMLGLGPGPHVVRTAYKRVAPPNFEAHNTVLDLFTQGGAIAVISVLWLVGAALRLTFKARLASLATLVCGLVIFSMFHLIVRLPIFWFAMALCLVAPLAARPAYAVAKWS